MKPDQRFSFLSLGFNRTCFEPMIEAPVDQKGHKDDWSSHLFSCSQRKKLSSSCCNIYYSARLGLLPFKLSSVSFFCSNDKILFLAIQQIPDFMTKHEARGGAVAEWPKALEKKKKWMENSNLETSGPQLANNLYQYSILG